MRVRPENTMTMLNTKEGSPRLSWSQELIYYSLLAWLGYDDQVTCLECRGTGEVKEHPVTRTPPTSYSCPRCDGTGLLPPASTSNLPPFDYNLIARGIAKLTEAQVITYCHCLMMSLKVPAQPYRDYQMVKFARSDVFEQACAILRTVHPLLAQPAKADSAKEIPLSHQLAVLAAAGYEMVTESDGTFWIITKAPADVAEVEGCPFKKKAMPSRDYLAEALLSLNSVQADCFIQYLCQAFVKNAENRHTVSLVSLMTTPLDILYAAFYRISAEETAASVRTILNAHEKTKDPDQPTQSR